MKKEKRKKREGREEKGEWRREKGKKRRERRRNKRKRKKKGKKEQRKKKRRPLCEGNLSWKLAFFISLTQMRLIGGTQKTLASVIFKNS